MSNGSLEDRYSEHRSGTWYHKETPLMLIELLEACRNQRTRVRLRYGDPSTGRDWLEESDMDGILGRSCGKMKVPLILARENSSGGPQILDHCVVMLMAEGRELWRHPHYHLPALEHRRRNEAEQSGDSRRLPYEVLVGGSVHARFPSERSLKIWWKRMTGASLSMGREKEEVASCLPGR